MTERRSLKNHLRRMFGSKGVLVELRYVNNRDVLFFSIEGAFGRKPLMTVSPDDIFDQHGNRFENDLDYARGHAPGN